MKYSEIVPEVNKILQQYDMPLTLRQIFYRLVSKLIIPNTVTAYKQLSRILVRARERGDIDDTRIEDRSRQVLGIGDYGWDSFDQFIQANIAHLKESWRYWARPLWETQGKQVLIALEKDALSRLFTEVADKYRVNVYPTRGYGSYTYIKQMAIRCNRTTPTVILYFGDYDPSGRDIQRDLEERLRRYGGDIIFEVKRIALTKEQIERYNLPPRPEDAATIEKLKRDPRAKTYGLEYAAELDALEPHILQEIIKKAIENEINHKKWNERVRQIEEEKEKLREIFSKLKITFEAD